ncbi:hypothetical protein AWT69_004799 [Pseudomonas putida]|nr:hypothetical protein AWT69_004799 [Pseudomonas putida]
MRNWARMVMLVICCCIDICKGLSLQMFQDIAIHLGALSLIGVAVWMCQVTGSGRMHGRMTVF